MVASLPVRTWIETTLKLFWGACALLSSLYCLLAYLPYTYFAFIKASPYPSLVWFVTHHTVLFWSATLAAVTVHWKEKPGWPYFAALTAQVGIAVALTFHPALLSLQNDKTAFVWSLVFLVPLVMFSARDALIAERGSPAENPEPQLFSYSNAIIVAAATALLFVMSMQYRHYADTHAWELGRRQLELTVWSVLSHTVVAIVLLSVLNLSRSLASRARYPRQLTLVLTFLLVFAVLDVGLVRLLANAFTFDGWAARLYAAALAVAVSSLGFSVWRPLLARRATAIDLRQMVFSLLLGGLLVAGVFVVPGAVRTRDWNGVLQHGFTLLVWFWFVVLIYRLRPVRRIYSIPAMLAVVLLSCFAYAAMRTTEILWSRALGPTDDSITDSLEQYAAMDPSFEMARQVLGAERTEACGDLCRILREYSNLRSPRISTEVSLVDHLAPSDAKRPNIFLFVMDSMRPDYLGAYNPHADFSPNLDSFARDSIVIHNAYTQYAGTLLSEPAIWSGAMLLHAHYMQPFSNVNSLEKLADTDGYRMIVSYDTVLRELLKPSDNMVRLDTDKQIWNQYEVCSTTEELEASLDSNRGPSAPVFFYAQPMNIHQFARNGLPIPSSANWRNRPGFNNRVAYQVQQADSCLGKFFDYLKRRKLYDDSIIIITSDHGDSTGELGRFGHSTHIFPEIMRVPLLIHLPAAMRSSVEWDDHRVSALTDIAPSLYYLLGHRPIRPSPMYGRPLFAETKSELESYQRDELFLASDVRAAYGILAENGRFLYVTYDSPPQSFLYDLASDPNAQHNLVTAQLKQQYDRRIIENLRGIADYYGYKPETGTFLASAR